MSLPPNKEKMGGQILLGLNRSYGPMTYDLHSWVSYSETVNEYVAEMGSNTVWDTKVCASPPHLAISFCRFLSPSGTLAACAVNVSVSRCPADRIPHWAQ